MTRKNFTLVELLLVIGIISLLMAFLLPSLAQAKGHAHKIACLGSLRQVEMHEMNYMSDHDGTIAPASLWPVPDPYTTSWCDANILGSYWGETPIYYGCSVSSKSKFLFCPSSSKKPPTTGTAGYSRNFGKQSGHVPQYSKIGRIKRPSTMIDFLDAHIVCWNPGWSGTWYSIQDSIAGDYSYGAPSCRENHSQRHVNGNTNCVFLDGHAASFHDLNAAYKAKQVNNDSGNNW